MKARIKDIPDVVSVYEAFGWGAVPNDVINGSISKEELVIINEDESFVYTESSAILKNAIEMVQ